MNIRFKRHFFQDEANGGEGAGSGGGGASQKTDPQAAGSPDPAAGAPKPTDAEAKLLKENMQKKDQIAKLQADVASAAAVAKQLEELGGLEAIKALVGAQKTAEEKKLEAAGDFERLKQRMAEEHAKALKAVQDEATAIKSQLGKKDAMIGELAVGSQFGLSKFIAEELTLTPSKAKLIYADHFDIGDDGKVVGYDRPRGSPTRTALVDAYGNAVAFDDAMRKIVEADPEKDHLLKSKTKAGAASASPQRPQNMSSQNKPMTSINKIASGLAGLKINIQ